MRDLRTRGPGGVAATASASRIDLAAVAEPDERSRLLREVAISLQRELLASQPPRLDELDVATRYEPGGEGRDVGGDWYDVIALGAGRVGLVVGDVMGRGVRAAAVMGQLRSAIRAYARLDLPPAELLALLDGLVHDLNPDQIVTALYAVFDSSSGELTVANAGHPAGLLVTTTGDVSHVGVPGGSALGTQGGAFPEMSMPLPIGTLIALFTDGLLAPWADDPDGGTGRFAAILDSGSGDLETLADRVLADLRRGASVDDAAVLLARVPGESAPSPVPHLTRLTLPRADRSPRLAREHTGLFLPAWDIDERVGHVATLLVSELVTNAIRHGRGSVELRLRRSPTKLVVEVLDYSGTLPQRRDAAVEDENGRGLLLVSLLAHRWGSRRTSTGKVVWAELDLPESGGADQP